MKRWWTIVVVKFIITSVKCTPKDKTIIQFPGKRSQISFSIKNLIILWFFVCLLNESKNCLFTFNMSKMRFLIHCFRNFENNFVVQKEFSDDISSNHFLNHWYLSNCHNKKKIFKTDKKWIWFAVQKSQNKICLRFLSIHFSISINEIFFNQ